ncbi:hypothetical protein BKA63DRAFT_571811 [Paraphoma chrysanthemicola]|nr:hypothetical protein BKA63DRAFT_571811 [Paraphoma chrysanthemicola]
MGKDSAVDHRASMRQNVTRANGLRRRGVQDALSMFEDWRRENIERRDEEDRFRAEINALEPRLRQRAHNKLAKHRSSLLYEDKTRHEDNVDEDACFAEVKMS